MINYLVFALPDCEATLQPDADAAARLIDLLDEKFAKVAERIQGRIDDISSSGRTINDVVGKLTAIAGGFAAASAIYKDFVNSQRVLPASRRVGA